MLDIQLISTIVGVFAGMGIMVAGCGYAYSSWKAGKNKYKDELILDLKTTLDIKEKEIVRLNEEKSTLILSHQSQLTELQKEFAALSARFDEQSKTIETYKALLEGRDPATLQMLTEIKNGIDMLNKYSMKSKERTEKVAKTLLESQV